MAIAVAANLPFSQDSGGGTSLTSDQQQRILTSVVVAFALTDEDIVSLRAAILSGRITSYLAAYNEAVALVGADDETTDEILDPMEEQDQEDDSDESADGIANTYHDDLLNQAMNLLGLVPPGMGEEEAQGHLAQGVAQWADQRAEWKAKQVANYETGAGANAGTNAAVDDLLGGDFGPINTDSVYVTVLPEFSSTDFCADYAGEVFTLDQYYDLPEFPAHPGCIHEKVIILGNYGEASAELAEEALFSSEEVLQDLLDSTAEADAAAANAEAVHGAPYPPLSAPEPRPIPHMHNLMGSDGQLITHRPRASTEEIARLRGERDVAHRREQEAAERWREAKQRLDVAPRFVSGWTATGNSAEWDAAFDAVNAAKVNWEREVYAREVTEADLSKAEGGRGAIVHLMQDNPDSVAAAHDAIHHMFSRDLTNDELASLVGAPEGSYVTIIGYAGKARKDAELGINLYGPRFDPFAADRLASIDAAEYHAERTVSVMGGRDGALKMYNESFSIRDDLQNSGIGSAIFADEAHSLSNLGFRKIETDAAGWLNSGSNGYYTWPRLGYDAKIPERELGLLKEAVGKGEAPVAWERYTKISQLYKTPEGREWWRINGRGSIHMEFDIRAGSKSLTILDGYLAERAARAAEKVEAARLAELVAQPGGLLAQRLAEIDALPDTAAKVVKWLDRTFPDVEFALKGGSDVTVLKDAARTLSRLADEYPEQFAQLHFFGLSSDAKVKPLMAEAFPETNGRAPRGWGGATGHLEQFAATDHLRYQDGIMMIYPGAWWKDGEKIATMIVESAQKGMWVEAAAGHGIDYVITHEFGHLLHESIEAGIGGDLASKALDRLAPHIFDYLSTNAEALGYPLTLLSEYGKSAWYEGFAEGFAALHVSPAEALEHEFFQRLQATLDLARGVEGAEERVAAFERLHLNEGYNRPGVSGARPPEPARAPQEVWRPAPPPEEPPFALPPLEPQRVVDVTRYDGMNRAELERHADEAAVRADTTRAAFRDLNARIAEADRDDIALSSAVFERYYDLQERYRIDRYEHAYIDARLDALAGGKGVVIDFNDEKVGLTDTAMSREEAFTQYFGRDLTHDEIAGLVGAQDGTFVTVVADRTYGITLQIHAPGYPATAASWESRAAFDTEHYVAFRTLLREPDGTLVMRNESFHVAPEMQGHGLGTRIFADEVRTLSDLDVDHIVTSAARSEEHNGYYTWVRLGYDGAIPESVLAKLPPEYAGYTRISEVMATPEGMAWWKENGTDWTGAFDLHAGSYSRQTLDAYLEQRGLTTTTTTTVQEAREAAVTTEETARSTSHLFMLSSTPEEARSAWADAEQNAGIREDQQVHGVLLDRLTADNTWDLVDSTSAAQTRLAFDLPNTQIGLGSYDPTTGKALRQVDVRTANQVGAALSVLAKDFPEVTTNLKFVGLDGLHPDYALKTPEERRLFAGYLWDTEKGISGIILNGTYWNAPNDATFWRMLRANEQQGVFIAGGNNPAYAVVHEFGHAVGSWVATLAQTDPAVRDIFEPFAAKWYTGYATAEGLGTYGRSAITEAFAEAFAALYVGDPAALPEMSRDIGKLLDDVKQALGREPIGLLPEAGTAGTAGGGIEGTSGLLALIPTDKDVPWPEPDAFPTYPRYQFGQGQTLNQTYSFTDADGHEFFAKYVALPRVAPLEQLASDLGQFTAHPDMFVPTRVYQDGRREYVVQPWLDRRELSTLNRGRTDDEVRALVRSLPPEQQWNALLHQYLVGDTDRNAGNILVTRDLQHVVSLDFGVAWSSPDRSDITLWENHLQGRIQPWEILSTPLLSNVRAATVIPHAEIVAIAANRDTILARAARDGWLTPEQLDELRTRLDVLSYLAQEPQPMAQHFVDLMRQALDGTLPPFTGTITTQFTPSHGAEAPTLLAHLGYVRLLVQTRAGQGAIIHLAQGTVTVTPAGVPLLDVLLADNWTLCSAAERTALPDLLALLPAEMQHEAYAILAA